MTNDARHGRTESTAGKHVGVMTASRLRDIIATCVGRHIDIDAVQFTRSAFADRLGLNVRDIDGATWRIWVAKDPWSRPGGDQ